MKKLLEDPKNKKLLVKYEESLPSWTVVMAQYTGYYRPWQRKLLRAIVFLASCVTLSIGLYDLYKHFPMFSTFLGDYMSELTEWLEEMIQLRMTLLMGYIIYLSTPFQYLFEYLFFSTASWDLLYSVCYPIT